MENEEDLKVFKMPHGKLYVNKGLAPQIIYDSNMEAIVIEPGESRFQSEFRRADLSQYFLSPALWNARKQADEVVKAKGFIKVVLDAFDVDKYGDQLMLTVIPVAYKDVYGEGVSIDVIVPDKRFKDIWRYHPCVEKVLFQRPPAAAYDVVVDTNNLELKFESRKFERKAGGRVNRTSLILEELGLFLADRTPCYTLTEEEEKWGRRTVAKATKPLIGIALESAGKCRTYSGMREVAAQLLKMGFGVVFLDSKSDGKYRWNFRELAAIINECDVVVTADSAVLHLAGALRKRIVGVFGNTDGEIFTENYEKAVVIQAPGCKYKKSPCWWVPLCLPGDTYQEKEAAGYAECMEKLPPSKVVKAVKDQLARPKRVLLVVLTYNLLEMTKKAIGSVRSFHEYDLFVVDNKSSDGTQGWLEDQGVEFVSVRTSVAGAQNVGIEKFLAGDYEYIVFLNNDIVLRYDTIDKLVEVAAKTKEFAVMATPFTQGVAPWLVDFNKPKGEEVENIVDIPAGSYSCTIFSRECIEKVGLFDERFTPRYIEDNDYTLRIRISGGKFLRSGAATYFHVLGGVIKTDTEEKKSHAKNWNKNIALFEEIWGIHPHEPQDLEKLGLEHKRDVTLRTLEKGIKRHGKLVVAVERRMGGWGDILFTTIVAAVLKKRFGKAVQMHYLVPREFWPALLNNPDIDAVEEPPLRRVHEPTIDLTDLEFRVELREIREHGKILSSRTKIYLDVLGSKSKKLKPVYVVTEEERKWAKREWEVIDGDRKGKQRFLIVLEGSNKMKIWPGMRTLAERLQKAGHSGVVLGEPFVYTFRQVGALVEQVDVVISPDSGVSNLAASLDVPVVTIFSNRNGKVFEQMFSSMVAVQGKCPHSQKKVSCDFKVPCFGPGSYRGKENIDIPDCLKGLTVEKVYKEVRKLLSAGCRHADIGGRNG